VTALQKARLEVDALLKDESIAYDDPRWLAALRAEADAAEALTRENETHRRRAATKETA
jgi:hypothetical protein